MKHIELNIWLACNHKCIFCMSGIARWKILWFENVSNLKHEIDTLSSKWYDSIWFLWWEPTIHPGFLELVSYAKQKGFINIEVITNWSKFHNKKILLECVKSGLTRISLSIHSLDYKKESILLWGIDNALDQKIESVKNIVYIYNKWLLKKELSINIVVTKKNYKDIYKLILYLYKFWVNSFRLNFVQLEWYSTQNYNLIAIKYENFKKYLLDIISLSKKYLDLRVNFEAIPWCFSWLNYKDYLIYSEQSIDREKDKISRDDIDFKSRNIINQLDRRKELKWYIKKCNMCFLKSNCEGIWKRYLEYFNIN